jgi:hypothetical protein
MLHGRRAGCLPGDHRHPSFVVERHPLDSIRSFESGGSVELGGHGGDRNGFISDAAIRHQVDTLSIADWRRGQRPDKLVND